jgi:hypothetical protein
VRDARFVVGRMADLRAWRRQQNASADEDGIEEEPLFI